MLVGVGARSKHTDLQAIESLEISDSLEVTAMTSKEKELVPFDTSMQASGRPLSS